MYGHLGYNLKVTDLQAAIGCEQIKKMPSFIEARRHNWEYLRTKLQPLEDKLILPEPAPNSIPSWFGFLISLRTESDLKRHEIIRTLEAKNIQTRLLFSGNIIRHPCFDTLRGSNAYRVVGDLSVSDFITENTFWIGVYPGMSDAMLDYMAQSLTECVRA